MKDIGFFPEQLGTALGCMVLHVLWQATVIGIAGGLVLLLMRRQPARYRYWAANAALAAILLVALGTFTYYYNGNASATAMTGPAAAIHHPVTGSTAPATAAYAAPAAQEWNTDTLNDYFHRHLPLIVIAWFLGMSLFLVRLLADIAKVYYLKTRLNFPADPYWQELLDCLIQKSGLYKSIRVLESALACTPQVVGHLKPVILFPVGMINRLDPREAEAILAHELAHILRKDYLFNILQSIAETLFYFHPVVWWLSGVIRHEREIAADDDAIRLTGNSMDYAKALVRVQDMAFTGSSFAPAFAGAPKNRLLHRVQHILNVQQSKNLAMEKFIGTCCILLVLLGIGYTQTRTTPRTADQTTQPPVSGDNRSGAWQGTIDKDQVCMSLVSRSANSSWMNGACFPASAFSALPTTEADFTLTRPAGTITFRGKFEGTEGYGRFQFAADAAFATWLTGQGVSGVNDDAMIHLFFANTGKEYVESLKKAGYNKISGEELTRLAIHEVQQKEIASFQEIAKDLNSPQPSIDELINLKVQGVDQDYVKAMLKTGLKGLSLETLQNAKIQDVTPEYIRQCRDLGFPDLDLDEIIGFKIHEITPEYIRQCQDMGYSKLNADEIMNFKIHEITPEYLNELKGAGLTALSADEAVNMRIHEVSPATLAEFRKMGFNALSSDDIINLRVHEINPAFLSDMQQIGFKGLSVDDAVNLRVHEINREYVQQLQQAGFSNLSVDDAVSCRIHEVDGALVKALNQLGFPKITVDDAVSLKIQEVTPEFIQSMRKKGFKDMSLEDYIQLKIQYGEKMK